MLPKASTVIPYRQIHQEVSEADRQELQVLRDLNVLQNYRIQGEDDEDCEVAFLDLMDMNVPCDGCDDHPEGVLYVSEPGTDRESKSNS